MSAKKRIRADFEGNDSVDEHYYETDTGDPVDIPMMEGYRIVRTGEELTTDDPNAP